MELKTESFLIKECETLVTEPEKLDEWKNKIEELGLTGQQELLTKPDKSPIPFLFMNEQMERVYGALCPTQIEIERFDKTPIPLDLLSLVALSKQEGYFNKIQIWYDDKQPDPVIVGYKEKTPYSGDHYLIGRWADELRPYVELVKLAIERVTNNLKIQIAKAKQEIDNANPSNMAERYINGEYVHQIGTVSIR